MNFCKHVCEYKYFMGLMRYRNNWLTLRPIDDWKQKNAPYNSLPWKGTTMHIEDCYCNHKRERTRDGHFGAILIGLLVYIEKKHLWFFFKKLIKVMQIWNLKAIGQLRTYMCS